MIFRTLKIMQEYLIYNSPRHEFYQKYPSTSLSFLATLIRAKYFNYNNENIFLDPITFGPHDILIHNKKNLNLLYITSNGNWTHQFALKEISYIIEHTNKYNSCEISYENFKILMNNAETTQNYENNHSILLYRDKNNWINFTIFLSYEDALAYIDHQALYNPKIYNKKYCYYKDDNNRYSKLYLEHFSPLQYVRQAIREFHWYKKSLNNILSESITYLHELIIFNDKKHNTLYIVYNHHHYGDVDKDEEINGCIFDIELHDDIFFNKLKELDHCKIDHNNFIKIEKIITNEKDSQLAQYAMAYYDQEEQICYKYFATQNEMYELSESILAIWHKKIPQEKK